MALFREAGLAPAEPVFYRLPFELGGMLARSFPDPAQVDAIRAAFVASVADDALGLETRHIGDEIHGAYRVAILSAVAA